jgi:hypothetical protein
MISALLEKGNFNKLLDRAHPLPRVWPLRIVSIPSAVQRRKFLDE